QHAQAQARTALASRRRLHVCTGAAPCQDGEEQGHVLYGPTQWPHVIQLLTDRDDTVESYGAEGRLQPYETAHRGRDPYRSAGIGTDGTVADAGGQGGRRSAR